MGRAVVQMDVCMDSLFWGNARPQFDPYEQPVLIRQLQGSVRRVGLGFASGKTGGPGWDRPVDAALPGFPLLVTLGRHKVLRDCTDKGHSC